MAIHFGDEVVVEQSKQVVGRFAPSPTGRLHMGSLLAAMASYLEARSHAGRWLLRMEDLDPEREEPGAAQSILADLERLGFEWDGEVVWQSQRHALYQAAFERLRADGMVYPCSCSRKDVLQAGLRGVDGPRYDGRCRAGCRKNASQLAWRIRVPDAILSFDDLLQGTQTQNLGKDLGDFVLLRADGCWSYQLAVVVDDAEQGVNQVVRGGDLLDSTPRQMYLQKALGLEQPAYTHIPVIANSQGEKLSKQTLATPLRPGAESDQLWQALRLLRQEPPAEIRYAGRSEVWNWAKKHWNVYHLPQIRVVSVALDENFEYKFI